MVLPYSNFHKVPYLPLWMSLKCQKVATWSPRTSMYVLTWKHAKRPRTFATEWISTRRGTCDWKIGPFLTTRLPLLAKARLIFSRCLGLASSNLAAAHFTLRAPYVKPFLLSLGVMPMQVKRMGVHLLCVAQAKHMECQALLWFLIMQMSSILSYILYNVGPIQ